MNETKTITIRELIDAVRKNGYEQSFGALFRADGYSKPAIVPGIDSPQYKIGSACALGQALLNLGITEFETVNDVALGMVIERIVGLNDGSQWTLEQIADALEPECKEIMDHTFEAPVFDYTPYLPEEI